MSNILKRALCALALLIFTSTAFAGDDPKVSEVFDAMARAIDARLKGNCGNTGCSIAPLKADDMKTQAEMYREIAKVFRERGK